MYYLVSSITTRFVRTNNTDILGQVLCLLIAQLGRPNPVIKGSAYAQVSFFLVINIQPLILS